MLFDTCFRMVSEKYASDIYNKASVENLDPSSSNSKEIKSLDISNVLTTIENPTEPVINETLFLSDSTGGNELIDSTFITEDSLLIKSDSTSILSDSTFIVNDSTSIPLDSALVNQDSTLAPKDSIPVNLDSLRLYEMGLDSTNRLKYFHYQREDKPYVELKEEQESKFFVEPTANLKRRIIQIDSTGKYVEIRELVASQETKIKLRIPIEDYINMKLALRERESWEQLGYEYKLKDTKVGLGELITSLTDFEIPLPSVGVLTIFGEPKIGLKIGGNVTIHGAWRSETTEGVTASRLGNTRNEPDFKQTVQINVNGTIGDKLNINADWNTERTFEYENQLKIKYTGYDDEIIQSIEAGNVSMQTSSLVGGAEALFGIKAQFKLGPFSLTTIASQKKGETKEVSVEGGSTAQEYDVRAYDYSTNHYFLDTVYASRDLKLFEKYHKNIPSIIDNRYLVTEIEVWKSINVVSADRSKERNANCYIDLPPIVTGQVYPDSLRNDILNPTPGKNASGRFLLLSPGIDYILHPETGFITFKTSLNEQDIIAVAFRQEDTPGPDLDLIYGEFLRTASADTSKRLILKLVKPQNLQPGGDYEQAWKLQLKNIYPTGSRNIKKEGFEFKIRYEIVGEEPTDELPSANGSLRLLEEFGFDQLNASGSSTPDNIFDWRPGYTIYTETGEIIFPTLEPFGRDIPPDLDSLNYQSVYDTTKTFARQDKAPDKWLMNGKSTGNVTSVYQLGFNVVENSVKVILNGRELSAGTDYIVDYNMGQLTIRNDAALVPGADLRVTYEQNDLFQLASKTLLGARGLYEFSDKTRLGFTVMNLNQQTLSDKVRIGEEPLSNTIYGADFKTAAELPFLTKALDFLISTREMSNFTFTGEYAYMSPDPNTKKSTISSDKGKSIAYIDDFEGAKRIVPVGVSYTGWKDTSPPEQLPLLPPGISRDEVMGYKAKSFWFSITPSDVTVEQIYGSRKKVAREDQQVTVMDYVFMPDTPGVNNWNPELSNPALTWGGMQKLLSSTANNLIEQNVEFIEFWMKIVDAPDTASLYLDMGLISEDMIPNNLLDTEDKNGNDAMEEGEDTGIDGIFDDEERIQSGSNKADPSGDNFSFVQRNPPIPEDYFGINGTEGNAVLTDVGLLPDTEDLNRNGNVDLVNSFFRYKIPLDTNRATNPFVSGGGDGTDKWYLYRIPIKDTSSIIGNPSFANIESIRLFTHGSDSLIHFRITEFNLVGSQWQKLVADDTVLSISVVSLEENPEYQSPPGVFQERDRTRPDQEVFRNEQSLNLILKELPVGESREAVKYLFRPLDVFNYKEMKLFIHGDVDTSFGSVSYVDSTTGKHSSEVFFRFGTDTSNYYEYRQPVIAGWNNIAILFDELTAVKQAAIDSSGIITVPVPGKRGHFYRVRGNPTLTSVKFLSVGIFNLNNEEGTNIPVSGEVWVNELRVVGADDSPGWAYSFSTSLKFADLLTVNFNMSERNPFFHRLADKFGSRVESRNWAVSTDIDILKLLPFNMRESNLRINYSHTESLGKPLYIPGTDVLVDEAVKQIENTPDTVIVEKQTPEQLISETQTINVSNTISAANIQLKIPIDVWFINDTWNALKFGFNYNNSFSRSPTVEKSLNWVWNANANYSVNLSPNLYIKLADLPIIGAVFQLFKDYKDAKIYFAPQNFAAVLTAKRNRNSNKTRPRNNNQTDEIIARDFTTSRGFNFGWRLTEGGLINLSTNYNLTINSSLAYLLEDEFGNDRTETDIWNDIIGGATFGKDYRYNQSFDVRTAPKLPSLWDINRYFTLNAGYSVQYQWNFDLRQEVLGRSAGYSRRFTAGLVLRWKSLTEPLFTPSEDKKEPEQTQNRTVIEEDTDLEDSTVTVVKQPGKPPAFLRALLFLRSVVKWVFFDWENFNINFSHENNVSKSGLKAYGTGFANFWGVTQNPANGPSRAFQLGLSSDVGPRAFSENTNLSDVFSEKNSIDVKTARPLWDGAKLDINWNVNWSMNKTTTLQANNLGTITINNVTSSGSITRTFLTLPPGLPFVDTGIKKVNALYNPNSEDPRQSLSDAFVKGFEALPLLSALPSFSSVAKFIPRPNWRISWDGLEKILFLKALADRISLDHAYTSTYTEGWKLSREGNQEIQTQRIEYGFSPLIGLNITFGKLWGGNLTGNIKFSSRNSYDLGLSTTNINETLSKDIGFTAGYSKSGFELPLFGVSLKNDIEFLLSYTTTRNSTIRYEMNNFTEEGIPQDGTTRTTIEPRIKYTISSKVSLSIYYKRSTVEPEGAARIPPTTTNEAGLDVNIVIQ